MQWCVPRPSATEAQLLDSIQFVCGEKGLPGCSLIQAGGSCFYPNTTINHASVVMNLWYQIEGRQTVSCWFKNTALITITDPSNLFFFFFSITSRVFALYFFLIFSYHILVCRLWRLQICVWSVDGSRSSICEINYSNIVPFWTVIYLSWYFQQYLKEVVFTFPTSVSFYSVSEYFLHLFQNMRPKYENFTTFWQLNPKICGICNS